MQGEHNRVCSVFGCGREGRRLDYRLKSEDGSSLRVKDGGKLLCEPHYHRLVKYGNPTSGPEIKMGAPAINEGKTCKCCSNPVWSRDLCMNHYNRALRIRKKQGISIEDAISAMMSSIRTAPTDKRSA